MTVKRTRHLSYGSVQLQSLSISAMKFLSSKRNTEVDHEIPSLALRKTMCDGAYWPHDFKLGSCFPMTWEGLEPFDLMNVSESRGKSLVPRAPQRGPNDTCLRQPNVCGDVGIKSSFDRKEDRIKTYSQFSNTKSTRPPSHEVALLTLLSCCLNKSTRPHSNHNFSKCDSQRCHDLQ